MNDTDFQPAIDELKKKAQQARYWEGKSEEARLQFQAQADGRRAQRDTYRKQAEGIERAVALLSGEPT